MAYNKENRRGKRMTSQEYSASVEAARRGSGGGDTDIEEISGMLAQVEIVEKKEIHLILGDDLPRNILYYGWFFSHEDSLFIKQIADAYLEECMKVPQFARFLKSACVAQDAKDPLTFYRYPRKPKSPEDFQYHITAKFLGREDNIPYSTFAKHFVGKKFQIALVGLFFTKDTFGVRVGLTAAQKRLFDEREGTSSTAVSRHSSWSIPKPTSSKKANPAEDHEANLKLLENELRQKKFEKKHPNCSSAVHNTNTSPKSICFVPRDPQDFRPSSSRAHVTIGVGPKVKPVQTGIDLLDIANLEKRRDSSTGVFVQDFPIDGGTLRQFGRHGDAFVVYPCHEIVAHAVFNYFI